MLPNVIHDNVPAAAAVRQVDQQGPWVICLFYRKMAEGGYSPGSSQPIHSIYDLGDWHKDIKERDKTFSVWPGPKELSTNLADVGFFYTGEKDVVQCFQCHIKEGNWHPGDDPWNRHRLKSPTCPMLAARPRRQRIPSRQNVAMPDNAIEARGAVPSPSEDIDDCMEAAEGAERLERNALDDRGIHLPREEQPDLMGASSPICNRFQFVLGQVRELGFSEEEITLGLDALLQERGKHQWPILANRTVCAEAKMTSTIRSLRSQNLMMYL